MTLKKNRRLAAAALCAALVSCAAQDGSAAKHHRPRHPGENENGGQTGMSALVKANNDFALKLFRNLPGGNLACSPYGVSEAFAMAYAGAQGKTAQELASAFGFPGHETLHKSYAALRGQLDKTSVGGNLTLQIADSLWPQKNYRLVPAYVNALKKYYGAAPTPVDYVAQTEQARKTINDWADEHTAGRIKDLLPPGTLNSATRLTLVNAVYFKGLWQAQFKKELTQDAPFTVAGGQTLNVPTMYQKQKLRYAQDELAQVLELPYKGGEASLLVALPEKGKTLGELEKAMNSELLGQWQAALKSREVNVYLPKFKAATFIDLIDALKPLGLNAPFGPSADFSAISAEGGLFISKALQKAFVEVNEEGTEAAATTAITFSKTAMIGDANRPVYFRADHPFLYILRHNPTGAILFMGRVDDPSK
ncbi:MAG: serpin family protein [Elusimicrobia bacterium]|nr:serpin family protein [Elusimicrobiota bacterium]